VHRDFLITLYNVGITCQYIRTRPVVAAVWSLADRQNGDVVQQRVRFLTTSWSACAVLMACKQYAYESFQTSGAVSMRSSLFLDVTERRSLVADVSVRVGPNFVGNHRSVLRNVLAERRSQHDAYLCIIPCTFIPQSIRNFIVFSE
jgi:hypothetical protein